MQTFLWNTLAYGYKISQKHFTSENENENIDFRTMKLQLMKLQQKHSKEIYEKFFFLGTIFVIKSVYVQWTAKRQPQEILTENKPKTNLLIWLQQKDMSRHGMRHMRLTPQIQAHFHLDVRLQFYKNTSATSDDYDFLLQKLTFRNHST